MVVAATTTPTPVAKTTNPAVPTPISITPASPTLATPPQAVDSVNVAPTPVAKSTNPAAPTPVPTTPASPPPAQVVSSGESSESVASRNSVRPPGQAAIVLGKKGATGTPSLWTNCSRFPFIKISQLFYEDCKPNCD
jgi:hypothetical protein